MRHGTTRWSPVAAALLLSSLILSGPVAASRTPAGSAPGTDSAATFEEGPCLWELPRNLDGGHAITCGHVTVPLFHADPDGETIRLAVGVVRPDRGDADGQPVLMLNGGPGGDSGPLLALFAPNFLASYADLRKGREVVVFDQRGTGFSEPGLYCQGDTDPTTGDLIGPEDSDDDPDEQAYEADGAACAASLGETTDLTAFTTTESARDIDDIRVALGYDGIDLWGQSYGTRLALEAMRLYPEGVISSVVLESVLAPDRPFLATFVVGFNDALVRLADACAGDQDCDTAFPDVTGDFERAVDRFNADPYDTSFADLSTGESTDVTVDGTVINYLVYQLVFSGIFVGVVPDFLHAVANGETAALEPYLPFLSETPVATGFYYSVLCQDEIPFESVAGTAAEVASAGVLPVIEDDRVGFGVSDYFAVCRGFGLPSSDAVQGEPVTSDIPTLIVSGEYDPITPPSNGEDAARTLPNSQVVVGSALAHTPIAFSQRCLLTGTIDFLDDPEHAIDFACADDLEVEFLTP